jgi:uncharacterized RDD family membrane protein YckC
MTCYFCGSRNVDGETRCRRCGRTPDDTLSYQNMGALAAQPQYRPVEAEVSAPPVSRPLSARPVQRSLFPEQGPKVVEMPPAGRAKPSKPRAPRTRTASRRVESQAELELVLSTAPAPRKLGTTVEAVIFCDAPVARRTHRAAAAAIDLSMVVIAFGLFIAGFHFTAGDYSLDKFGLIGLVAGLPLLAFTYGLLWAVCGLETFGMRCAHLRLLNFDGFPPERRQRMARFAASCLGILPCGLGVIWALADEEALSWADHVSSTFPTSRDADSQTFCRR